MVQRSPDQQEEIIYIESLISEKFGDKFAIKHTVSGKGKLVIDYADVAELKKIIKRIR